MRIPGRPGANPTTFEGTSAQHQLATKLEEALGQHRSLRDFSELHGSERDLFIHCSDNNAIALRVALIQAGCKEEDGNASGTQLRYNVKGMPGTLYVKIQCPTPAVLAKR